MPQCKLDGCKEEAVPGGKRFCPVHKARYLQRRNEAIARDAALPACSTRGCAGKVHWFLDELLCDDCFDRRQEEARSALKLKLLYEATTVDDLREWISKYVIAN